MSLRRAHVLISGRVQGVFFRQSAATEAQHLGLTGWVRNLADGRVEAEAEGTAEAVEAFIAFCRRGPAGARVEAVVQAEKHTQSDVDFRVERSG
jgi:acylphosphatase